MDILTGLKRIDGALRSGLPFVGCLLLVLLEATPGLGPGAERVMLPLLPIGLFLVVLHRPKLMPGWLAFILGLVQDLLTGAPLGLGALLAMGFCHFVAEQRRFLLRQPFLLTWLAFALVLMGLMVVQCLLMVLWLWALVPLGPVLVSWLIGVGLFPPITAMVLRLQRHVLLQPTSG